MQKHLEGRFERDDHADMPDGHSSLASALVVTTLGVRRAKEVGTAARSRRRHRASLGSSTASNVRKHNFGTFTATFARPFDLHAVLATPRRWAQSSKLVGGKQLVSPAQCFSQSGRKLAAREHAARETRREANLFRARGLTALGRVRVSYCSCRSRRAVPAQVVVELSQFQQRRGLVFHSVVFSGCPQGPLGKKKTKK